jgi:aldehyde:ferredoxin oxidoreductase
VAGPPTGNYRYTHLAGYEEIGGRAMTKTFLLDRLTCAHCPVQCRREVGANGKYRYVTEGPDYSQLSALGSNCRVTDLAALGYMNHLCYELGLDPIEMGNTLAMLAEATERGRVRDGLRWGDADRMIELIQRTGAEQGIGEVLARGASRAAATLGVPELRMAVKGIPLQNVDPRPEPAWGLLNATETLGGAAHIWTYADLVSGMREAEVSPLVNLRSTPREVAEAVWSRQNEVAVLDSLTSCAFSSYAFTADDYAEALTLFTGEPFTSETLRIAGERIFARERQYNLANGFTASDDTLPARFTPEGVPDGLHATGATRLSPGRWAARIGGYANGGGVAGPGRPLQDAPHQRHGAVKLFGGRLVHTDETLARCFERKRFVSLGERLMSADTRPPPRPGQRLHACAPAPAGLVQGV